MLAVLLFFSIRYGIVTLTVDSKRDWVKRVSLMPTNNENLCVDFTYKSNRSQRISSMSVCGGIEVFRDHVDCRLCRERWQIRLDQYIVWQMFQPRQWKNLWLCNRLMWHSDYLSEKNMVYFNPGIKACAPSWLSNSTNWWSWWKQSLSVAFSVFVGVN